jgi:hypothetical protein
MRVMELQCRSNVSLRNHTSLRLGFLARRSPRRSLAFGQVLYPFLGLFRTARCDVRDFGQRRCQFGCLTPKDLPTASDSLAAR